MTDGTRLTGITPAEMSSEQRAVYDAIVTSPRGASSRLDADGSLPGPFNAMLLSPAVGMALQNLGSALRYESTLPDLVRELVILLVAGRADSAYEQYAHEPLAREAGADEETLAELRSGNLPTEVSDEVAAALGVADALLGWGLDDEAYAAAVASVGEAWLFEINAVVGYYQLLARQLGLFGVLAPEGER
ncbi:carboxymuconolactone decarboxylase family protein [Ammonicoccus fulvus]|uniref:Carboxymuconolactone decarboxylase family protein n=1 Tax=Ammonicoccus fulvus TaxID=3138240 RepID=A0ABZ3FJ57_9ACTN